MYRLSPLLITPMYVSRGETHLQSIIVLTRQLIATKARDFVYNDEASDIASTLSGGSGPRNQTFDPLKLSKSRLLTAKS